MLYEVNAEAPPQEECTMIATQHSNGAKATHSLDGVRQNGFLRKTSIVLFIPHSAHQFLISVIRIDELIVRMKRRLSKPEGASIVL